MIFWRGKGILVLLSAGLAALIVFGLLGHILQISPYGNEHHQGAETLQIGATIMGTAAFLNTVFLFMPLLRDRRDDRPRHPDGRILSNTGRGSSFMFIPRAAWSAIYGLISLVLIVLMLVQ